MWTFPAQHRTRDEDGQVLHPAPFPEELARRVITLFSYRDARICDPFVGSGTTAVVAHRLGRRCWAFDKSPTYAAQTRERLAKEIAP